MQSYGIDETNEYENNPIDGEIVVPPTFSPLASDLQNTVQLKYNHEYLSVHFHELVTSFDLFLELKTFVQDLLI